MSSTAEFPKYWIAKKTVKGWRKLHGREQCAGPNAEVADGIMSVQGKNVHICKKCLGSGQKTRETLRMNIHPATVELVPEAAVRHLRRQSHNLLTGLEAMAGALLVLAIGWPWELAATWALAVVFYRRMFL